LSIYFTITTVTTIGYGDIKPINTVERIFMIIFALFACCLFGYIINGVGQILSELDSENEQYR